jgi:hypothetical protein
MKHQKAYVREDGTTVLMCPYCGHARTVSVALLKEKKKVITVKCSCEKTYTVNLEQRKLYRKNTNLNGSYINFSRDNEKGKMIVRDISMGGIGFKVLGECNIEKDDELEVTFTLDDTHSSVIKKQVVTRIVQGNYVGCEFLHHFEYDKALGFYILP